MRGGVWGSYSLQRFKKVTATRRRAAVAKSRQGHTHHDCSTSTCNSRQGTGGIAQPMRLLTSRTCSWHLRLRSATAWSSAAVSGRVRTLV
jgi:hypothetical protein